MSSIAATVGDPTDEFLLVTPELVLVDPELARRVRPRIPLSFRRRTPPLPPLHLVGDGEDDARAGDRDTRASAVL